MSKPNPTELNPSPSELRKFASEVMLQESTAIERASKLLDQEFDCALETILNCCGSVIVSGIGKSGLIGKKICATLSSTGTPSHFVHPTEAMHGDLGSVGKKDVTLLLSYSGATDEVISLAAILRQDGIPIVSISCDSGSRLGTISTAALSIGNIQEACPYNLAPTASTAAMLAVGDALALAVSRARSFGPEDFHKVHPGGLLGKEMLPVTEMLRFEVGRNVAVCSPGKSLRDILREAEAIGRRSGAILVTDEQGRLTGILTDGDLRRLLATRGVDVLEAEIETVMTCRPISLLATDLVKDAIQLVRERRVDEIPVVDNNGIPVGIIDVQDLISLKLIND